MREEDAITIRPAERNDAADLAIVDNMASHGMSLEFWQNAAAEGEGPDALVLARARFADPESVFGWSNALIAEEGGVTLGSVTAYEMPEPDEEIDTIKKTFPAFAPVFELFERAVGDWFVDSMGVFPEARRRGMAARLLDACLAKGSRLGHSRAALVVESDNSPAVALYASRGFETRESLPYVTADGDAGDRKWLLMSAAITAK